jgi:uncharacterized protein (DUF924 family)
MESEYDNYVEIILKYWFSGNKNADFKRWFKSGEKYDSEIRNKFSNVLKEAEKGNLLHWLGNSRSFLAHIILLDQFSRHIYRGTPEAYKNDGKIMLFMEMAIDKYIDNYNASEQMFILLPYQHSENLSEQKKGLLILNDLISKEEDMTQKNILKTALHHQKGHFNVIKKHGRFPKRNYLLGRLSTVDEIDYMDGSENVPY